MVSRAKYIGPSARLGRFAPSCIAQDDKKFLGRGIATTLKSYPQRLAVFLLYWIHLYPDRPVCGYLKPDSQVSSNAPFLPVMRARRSGFFPAFTSTLSPSWPATRRTSFIDGDSMEKRSRVQPAGASCEG